ncbi:MAG: phosphatidylserine decarboxylase [Gammaproteobacteria bacterium]|nr:phosphatidylserine decarboxylase [Gammaproteobacteria bacterium]
MNQKNTPSAGLIDYLKALPQYLLPHHLLSRLMSRLTHCRWRGFKNGFIRAMARLYNINMQEAESPDAEHYEHFNHFFTRKLKDGARPIDLADNVIVSPVDGAFSQLGPITDGRVFQAKGRSYTVEELLGGDRELAQQFTGGEFATIYLSPQDYHRIHMPVAGTLQEMIHVPGRLFSVSPATTRVIPRLFSRNERVVSIFDTDQGPVAMVLVGAIFVASIETVWSGVVTPPMGKKVRRWDYRQEAQTPQLAKGVEMGRFNMGSTVVMLFPGGKCQWNASLQPGSKIKMGEAIATTSE